MRTIRLEMIVGAVATVVLLGVLSMATDLGAAGWLVGLVCGWGVTALLAAGRARTTPKLIYPADWVTLGRAVLIAGVGALVAESIVGPLALTGANTAGRPLPTSYEQAQEQLGDLVAVYLDAGPLGSAAATSTVVDGRGPVPQVLRRGGLTVERLRDVVPGLLDLEQTSV